MRYEIINPSDIYTIDCPTLDIAAVACVMLGAGQYTFEPVAETSAETVPAFVFGGAEAADTWFREHCHDTYVNVVRRVQTDLVQREQLAEALDSVFIGSLRERELYDLATQTLSDTDRRRVREPWHDKRRSSLNDIGARAWAMARRLRGEGVPVDPTPQQVFLQ